MYFVFLSIISLSLIHRFFLKIPFIFIPQDVIIKTDESEKFTHSSMKNYIKFERTVSGNSEHLWFVSSLKYLR